MSQLRALTIWQPYAQLIILGLKQVEYRAYSYGDRLAGQRIVIHAGKTKPFPHIHDLLASKGRIEASCGEDCDVEAVREVLERMLDTRDVVLSAGLGTAVLGRCQRDPGMNWAWPLTEPERWAVPVPSKGAQGFWFWRG